MIIPRPDEKSKEFFRSILPDNPQVTIRPMFGNISAFVNGNMFAGLFGNDIFVRLSDENRRELLREKGASLLEPMKGKPMKEYIVIPKTWKNQPETIRLWLSRSLDWTTKLPPKKSKKQSSSDQFPSNPRITSISDRRHV
jgi:TfoX/Sxy family transcriptional regulator of competence genes